MGRECGAVYFGERSQLVFRFEKKQGDVNFLAFFLNLAWLQQTTVCLRRPEDTECLLKRPQERDRYQDRYRDRDLWSPSCCYKAFTWSTSCEKRSAGYPFWLAVELKTVDDRRVVIS